MKAKKRTPPGPADGAKKRVRTRHGQPHVNEDRCARPPAQQEALLPAERRWETGERVEDTVRYLKSWLHVGGDIFLKRRTWEMSGGFDAAKEAALAPKPSKAAISAVLCPEGIHHLIGPGNCFFGCGLLAVEEAAKKLGVAPTAIYAAEDEGWMGGSLRWRGRPYVLCKKVRRLRRLLSIMRKEGSR